jgi:hypothetical protein
LPKRDWNQRHSRTLFVEFTILLRQTTEWLRNDILKVTYSQKIISKPEEYDELIKLDEEQITDFLLDWIDYKKNQGVKLKTISTISSVEIFFDMNGNYSIEN